MKKLLIVTFAILFVNSYLSAQIQYYVSPTGSDSNAGSATQPFASLHAARNAIRQYKSTHKTPVSFVVNIADGTYYMSETFRLEPIDSGTAEHPIIYKAEKGASPVFSGGKKITTPSQVENGIWEIKIPECQYYKWQFDQLYVNNKRATLARTPNSGFLKIQDVQEDVWVKGEGRLAEKAQQRIAFAPADLASLGQLSAKEIQQIRLKAYHKWDYTLKYLDKADIDSSLLFTSGRGMKPWNPLKKNVRVVLENYKAALDTAGEWFLSKQGTLYYKPLAGQTPENTEFVAPVLSTLVRFSGNTEAGQFVKHIKFEGLTFSHCHYPIPQSGFDPNQAATVLNAAISLSGAQNITFSACEISDVGQHALWFEQGCSNSVVEHCYLHDLGGGGIYLGAKNVLPGNQHTHHITLNNNIIQSGGKAFPPAVGIWVGHSSDCQVTHNDIGNFYYTGISVGWTWGYAPSPAKRNTISYNHIHHIGWDLLSDMAGIYTLGASEGTVVSNNVVHHIHAYSYGGWGLYCDEGSSGILLENNLVYSTKTGGFQQHYGKENIIKNNILASAKLYQTQCTRAEEHRSFSFTNNIVIFNSGVVLKGAWKEADVFMDRNLYWNTSNDSYDFAGLSFEEWQKSGHDEHSIIAKPNFKDASRFNFHFKNKTACRKIDFKPFDYSNAGVYGSEEWTDKAVLPQNILDAFDRRVSRNLENDELIKSRL